MQIFAVLCLAAVALARPQDYNTKGAVTTVTERTFTIRGDADKYYGAGASGSSSYSAGSGYAGGVSSYSAAQPSYSFKTVASALPVAQQQSYQTYQTYQQAAPAPAVNYQASYQAAPVSYQASYAAPAFTAVTAAPAVAYHAVNTYAAAPAVSYAAAPALSYAAAPAVSYAAAAPTVSYAAAAPTLNYAAAAPAVYQQQAQSVGIRAETNYGNNYEQGNYETSFQDSHVSGADTKVFKHVYAFAAPEEPATRATVRVQAPVSKRKHYKLVFIKAPSQQTIVDSDITLPAQEEEKTLIYVLSKNQKQQQPEIRIKQAAASKHAKPEVFFLKYKNEAEAQAIASGAISGQSADIPAQGEIISDGSVSILGQSSGSDSASAYNAGSSFGSSSFGSNGASFGSNFGSSGANFGSSGASFDASSVRSGARQVAVAAPVEYRSSGVSAVSSGSLGLSSPVIATINEAPAASGFSFGSGSGSGSSAYNGASSAGLSGGFSAYNSGSSSYNQEPASVAISVTTEPSQSFEGSTASSLSL